MAAEGHVSVGFVLAARGNNAAMNTLTEPPAAQKTPPCCAEHLLSEVGVFSRFALTSEQKSITSKGPMRASR